MTLFSGMELKGDRPVYAQMIEYIKIQIHLGHIANGNELPSRREVAGTLGVNPNTVQKAYKLLESEGIIQTGNNVKSVIVVNDEIRKKVTEELTYQTVSSFINYAKSLNMSFKDIIDLISELWT